MNMDFKIQLDGLINYVEVNYMAIFYVLFFIIIIVISLMISIKVLTNTNIILKQQQMPKFLKEMEFPKVEVVAKNMTRDELMTVVSKEPAIIKNNKGQKYVDLNREIKDLMTEFVVNEFFQDKTQIYNFLSDIMTMHNDAIANYISEKGLKSGDILFLFKGGNVLRMIGNEFIYQLPKNVAELLKAFYKPMFKRSDADFSIYVSPDAVNQIPGIHDDMSQLSYMVQYSLRTRFSTEPSRYFSFLIKSDDEKHRILNMYLERAKNANMLKDAENGNWYEIEITDLMFDMQGVNDKLIKFGKNEESIEIHPKMHDDEFVKPHTIYINDNRALKFCKTEGKCISPVEFNLTRSKINFTLDTSKGNVNVGGELIDVSIGKDESIKKFFENIGDNMTEYNLKFDEDNQLKFKSYSIDYLAKDIEKILFTDTNNKPWIDNKYAKRINRLVFLGFIEEYSLKENNDKLSSFIKRIRDILNSKMDLTEIPKGKIWKRLFDYSKMVRNDAVNQEDVMEYDKYIENIDNNFKILEDAMYNLIGYIREQGAIKQNEVYTSSTENLI